MLHPDTVAALDSARTLVHAVDDMFDEVGKIRARRPSPSGRVIPEVDAEGRLTDLYIAPGTIAASERGELISEIMSAVHDSTVDALRQREITVRETTWPAPKRQP
ncbi:hypothetical protein [Nocardia rhamnosiphila]|uniref:YbaB/EbfC DNA-binding family protein n=1 Tax=Nocardia rhamnosiphila TaxID=426716 RepID=A0ABV2WZT8_9NOCA